VLTAETERRVSILPPKHAVVQTRGLVLGDDVEDLRPDVARAERFEHTRAGLQEHWDNAPHDLVHEAGRLR
jgi:hypothetical protein